MKIVCRAGFELEAERRDGYSRCVAATSPPPSPLSPTTTLATHERALSSSSPSLLAPWSSSQSQIVQPIGRWEPPIAHCVPSTFCFSTRALTYNAVFGLHKTRRFVVRCRVPHRLHAFFHELASARILQSGDFIQHTRVARMLCIAGFEVEGATEVTCVQGRLLFAQLGTCRPSELMTKKT